MIKKTILPLFTTTLMFFGTQTIYSVESKKDDLEIGTTAKSSATTGSPFLAQGNVADLRLQRTMAKLMPQDEKAFQALTRYTGGDWNPLEPIDEEGLLEMVKYESNLKAKLSKIMAKVLQDPELRGENPPYFYLLPCQYQGVRNSLSKQKWKMILCQNTTQISS